MGITIVIIVMAIIIATYPKWSYRQWCYRCEKDIIPFTGRRKGAE